MENKQKTRFNPKDSIMVTFYSIGIVTGITICGLAIIEYFFIFIGTSTPTPLYLAILGSIILILSLAGEIALNSLPTLKGRVSLEAI